MKEMGRAYDLEDRLVNFAVQMIIEQRRMNTEGTDTNEGNGQSI